MEWYESTNEEVNSSSCLFDSNDCDNCDSRCDDCDSRCDYECTYDEPSCDSLTGGCSCDYDGHDTCYRD